MDPRPPGTAGAAAAGAAWFGYWNLMRRYHRFEVRGVERVTAPGAALIAGYHGRPIAHDLCMLQALLHARGEAVPHAVVHAAVGGMAPLRALAAGAAMVAGDGAGLAAVLARGGKVIVTPGGTREGCRSRRDRYRVDWGARTGYLRLALRHGLAVIPTAATGVDDTYVGLNDGYAWGRRLRVPAKLPLWFGVGPLGLWPLSPPFPVKITLHVGAPVDVAAAGVEPGDARGLLALHARVTAAVQDLLDTARGVRKSPAPEGHAEHSGR